MYTILIQKNLNHDLTLRAFEEIKVNNPVNEICCC